MEKDKDFGITRREFVAATLAAPILLYDRDALAATPACGDSEDITLEQTPGPFFKPRSPERRSLLEPGIQGAKIIIEGAVRSTQCKPIEKVLIDFWQADARGEYDNTGFRLRGHQFTDGAGKYRLETIVPGLYPGRTRHFHVRVQAPNRPVLTTQLYFPGEPENKKDGIFNPKLVMAIRELAGAKAASFDFVVQV